MHDALRPFAASAGGALKGRLRVPGDKSISHRALIFGALAVGETRITGLLEGEDVLNTAKALRQLGARIERRGAGAWSVRGIGVGGFAEPAAPLDFGNAGTGCRLMLGAVAGCPITAIFDGDASLRRRPMRRVLDPLERIGARLLASQEGHLPLTLAGARDPIPIVYESPVPSAQVKSAVLLAGLGAPGEMVVIEREATRDHTEKMLAHFGAQVRVDDLPIDANGVAGRRIALAGQPELVPQPIRVPADPSSAAFPAVAALILGGSAISIEGVGMNPLRAGLYDTLAEMGARIARANERVEGGEPVADLVIEASRLAGVTVPAERAPRMIDEYPILAVAAAFAHGRTVMHGLAELRVKESDRLTAIADGLGRCGVVVAVEGDTMIIDGCGGPPQGGGAIAARFDHRIAMAFLVLGMAAERPVTIDDGATIATSFPSFTALMNGLGAAIAETAA
jgi:3-phosphoshikimate 1-carboxyvinyltransferase